MDLPLEPTAHRHRSAAAPEPLLPGAVVGRFVILGQLGAGAMGVVHLAFDPKLDRKIALKCLYASTPELLPRLLREAQALAKVRDANVVTIYDVGSVGARVWLAMELIEGETFEAWLETPRRWRELLPVLEAAGRGIQAVHAAGLVHRDLKPSNLMIDRDGRVRVMDFGLARAELSPGSAESTLSELTADTSATGEVSALDVTLTRTGTLLGTPGYMAPEQFRGGAVDARADQFGFCVLAWRALFGERPFVGDSLMALRLAVLNGRRRPPPRSSVPSWLRAVLERGLAVDPEARWPSMAALLDAIESGRRRTNRRRIAAVVATLGLAGAGVWAVEAELAARDLAERVDACEVESRGLASRWDEAARERIAAAFVASGSPLADDGWPLLRDRVDAVVGDWSAARRQLCHEAEIDGTRTPTAAEDGRRCLDEQAEILASFLATLEQVDEDGVGKAFLMLARLAPASACLDAAAVAQRARLPDDPQQRERAVQLRAAIARFDGGALFSGRASEDAASLLTEAEELGFAPLVAEAAFRVASTDSDAGDFARAEAGYERALLLAGAQRDDALAVDAASKLGFVCYEQGEHEAGERWIEIGRMLVGRSTVDLGLAEAHLAHAAGAVALGRGDLDAASQAHVETLAAYRRLLPADHPDIGKVLVANCAVESKRGRHEEARRDCTQGLAILERSFPRMHPARALALNNIAVMYLDNHEIEPALPLLRESLDITVTTRGAEHPDVGLAHNNIGIALLDGGRARESEPEFDRAIEIWTASLREDHPMFAYPLTGKGRALIELGRPGEAVVLLRRALALRSSEDVLPVDRSDTQFALARALAAEPAATDAALEEAVSLANAALAVFREADEREMVEAVETWLSRLQ